MDQGMAVLVLVLGLGVSVASGLLGIGGGIVLAPLLLYLPPALGLGVLTIQAVTGLTMVQGLFGATSGIVQHSRHGFVSWRLVAYMGPAIALSALFGAALSQFVHAEVLLAAFATLALVAAGLMLLPARGDKDSGEPGEVQFSRPLAVAVAVGVGFVGGLVGQGGAFILIPLLLAVLRLPTRVALGSSLGIVFCSALAGLVGKLGTGQVDLPLALVLVVGAIPGAQLGGLVSGRVRPDHLRQLLAVLIALAAMRMWSEVITTLLPLAAPPPPLG